MSVSVYVNVSCPVSVSMDVCVIYVSVRVWGVTALVCVRGDPCYEVRRVNRGLTPVSLQLRNSMRSKEDRARGH